jgi:hypothetical protein
MIQYVMSLQIAHRIGFASTWDENIYRHFLKLCSNLPINELTSCKRHNKDSKEDCVLGERYHLSI